MAASPKRREQMILGWVLSLKSLCRSSGGSGETEAFQVSEYTQALLALPAAWFCDESRLYVASKADFFPSFARVIELLSAWNTERKHPMALLPGGDDQTLSVVDRCWLSAWNRRGENPGHSPVRLLATIHSLAPAAYVYLVKTDDAAANIAVLRGWETQPEDDRLVSLKSEWDDPDGIRRRVAELSEDFRSGRPLARACLLLLRGAVLRHAPQHLPLVPASFP